MLLFSSTLLDTTSAELAMLSPPGVAIGDADLSENLDLCEAYKWTIKLGAWPLKAELYSAQTVSTFSFYVILLLEGPFSSFEARVRG